MLPTETSILQIRGTSVFIKQIPAMTTRVVYIETNKYVYWWLWTSERPPGVFAFSFRCAQIARFTKG